MLLAAWGPVDPCHPADFNGDEMVNVGDMLSLLNNWGSCPGYPSESVPTLEQEMTAAGLTLNDWNDFTTVMTGSDEQAKANWLCWMQNRIAQCSTCPPCPGLDPFD